MVKIFLFTLIFFLSATLFSGEISGKVVSVEEGDEVTILTSSEKRLRVRLYGID